MTAKHMSKGWPAAWVGLELIAMSRGQCPHCAGVGRMDTRRGWRPCECVLRLAFRAVMERYEEVCASGPRPPDVESAWMYGRKREEFAADVMLTAKRELSQDEWRVFDLHVLRGADWNLCCRQLKLDRGNFFHAVYRIQSRLGRAFVEAGLFPTRDYFAGRYLSLESELNSRPKHHMRLGALESAPFLPQWGG
jgi:hypothetical protein